MVVPPEMPGFPMWQLNPWDLVLVALGVVNELGVRRLAQRQGATSRRATRRRSWCYYAGLVLLGLVISGPLEHWGMVWLSVHMVGHVAEMFYLPVLLVVGGPRVPALFALGVDRRRQVLRWYYRSASGAPVRATVAVLTTPWVAIVAFNATMVLWHLPAVFNAAMWHPWIDTWVMTPSFLVTGVLFWRLLLGSHPSPPRATTQLQLVAIAVTAMEMLVVAMALSVLSHGAWYSMNLAMLGPIDALRDQHLAAGILWICGDLWAVPALVLIARRVVDERGSVSMALEHALGRA